MLSKSQYAQSPTSTCRCQSTGKEGDDPVRVRPKVAGGGSYQTGKDMYGVMWDEGAGREGFGSGGIDEVTVLIQSWAGVASELS